MLKKTLLLTLASLVLLSTVYAYEDHKCTHGLDGHPEPEVNEDAEVIDLTGEGRTLASYPNFRMTVNTENIVAEGKEYHDYFRNDIAGPIISYFSSALKVKHPNAKPLKFSASTKSLCALPVPAELKSGPGVDTDFYLFLRTANDPGAIYVASTWACFLTSGIKRPYIASTTINSAIMKVTKDVLLHEKNMVCIMHEITHALGFAGSLFKHFIDNNGKKLSGHIITSVLDGNSQTVLNVEPLTTRLRNHFGCSSLKGAYLENDSSSSHFERRHLSMEYMSSSYVHQAQVSQFTLALLEGSGWYVADYSYADNYFLGQGQGCNFLLQSCTAKGFSFDEFCYGGAFRACTSIGRGGGICGSDTRANGCKITQARLSNDCENEEGVEYARLPEIETYGRYSGAKCFMGTLSKTSKASSSTSFCLKPACSGSGRKTVLTLSVGKNKVKCTKEGEVAVPGYGGVIKCPDPVTFCSTVGKKSCPRGCMGRGQCLNGKCVCNNGFTGLDCALNNSTW